MRLGLTRPSLTSVPGEPPKADKSRAIMKKTDR